MTLYSFLPALSCSFSCVCVSISLTCIIFPPFSEPLPPGYTPPFPPLLICLLFIFPYSLNLSNPAIYHVFLDFFSPFFFLPLFPCFSFLVIHSLPSPSLSASRFTPFLSFSLNLLFLSFLSFPLQLFLHAFLCFPLAMFLPSFVSYPLPTFSSPSSPGLSSSTSSPVFLSLFPSSFAPNSWPVWTIDVFPFLLSYFSQ